MNAPEKFTLASTLSQKFPLCYLVNFATEKVNH